MNKEKITMNKVEKTTNNTVATVGTSMFMTDAKTQSGLENITQKELALPFLKLLVQLSPQCNKTSNNFVEGAEPGMIYNTVSGKLYDGEKGINVIPCYFKKEYLECGERGSSGAPKTDHGQEFDLSKSPKDANYQNRLPNGNVIEETGNYYVLVTDGQETESALIVMKATALIASRKWNSMMLGIKMQGEEGAFTPPMYSHIYKLTTVPKSNSKGTWFGWDIKKVGPVSSQDAYEDAKSFLQAVSKNAVKVSREEEAQAAISSSY